MAEVGSVYVSVIPSMRGFTTKVRAEMAGLRDLDVSIRPTVDRREVKREVDNATRGANALVRIDADISETKRRIAETRRQLLALEAMETSPEVTAVTERARASLASLRTELGDLERRRPEVKVDADTAAATQRVSLWERTVGRVRATASLDLDTSAATSRLVAFSTVLGGVSVGTGLAALVPFFLSLGHSIQETVGIAATLPAFLGAAAVGALTLKAAFTGFGDAIGDDPAKAAEAMAAMAPSARAAANAVNSLKPAWQGLQLDVQSRLFEGLGARIAGLGGTYIPILRGAMAGLASDINGHVITAFDVLRERGNVSGIATGLGFVRQGLASMFGALAPVTQAFTTLFVAGAPYVARFGAWVQSSARSFSLFIGEASRAGQITVWIERALLVFRQLGQIARNTGSILGSLFGAAAASGESLLSILARVSGSAADALKSPETAATLAETFTTLRGLGGLLWDRFMQLWPAISSVGRAFFDLLEGARPITDLFLSALVPAITAFADAISFLAPVLGPLLGLYVVWTAAQWALNVAMMANPIGLVIGLLVGLVAGAIYAYQNFEFFRNAVDAVGRAFMWVWTSVLEPLVGFFQGAFGAALRWITENWSWLSTTIGILVGPIGWVVLAFTTFRETTMAVIHEVGGFFSWLWSTVLSPVFSAIGEGLAFLGTVIGTVLVAPFVIAWNVVSALVSGVWNSVLRPIWYGAIVPALQFLGSMFSWLWQSVIIPVWNGIASAVSVAWATISAIFTTVIGVVRGAFTAAWNFLWHSVIVPVWTGISGAISGAWNFIRDNVFTPIGNFLRTNLGPVFTWLRDSVITPVWNGIRDAISGAWDFIQGVFDTGKRAVEAVGDTFRSVADFISDQWNRIREATRGPVQFVVDVVYNNGIRPVWNGIAGLFGMAQLNPVRFAAGGVLPGYTPGRDIYPAMLSGGEGILVPEAVRALGPSFVGWANRTFSGGRSDGGAGTPRGGRGFSRGGVAHFAEGGIMGALAGAGDFFASVFTDPTAAVRKLFGGVLGDGARTPGTGAWTDALKRVPGKVVDGVIARVKKWIEEMASMTGGAGGNWAPVAAQALAITGQPQSLLWRVLKQIQIESGGNPRAINLWDINAKRGTPSKGLIQTIDPTFRAYRHPGLPNDPYHPLANLVAGIRYAISRYGSIQAIWPKTMGYDRGGIANGVGLMAKQTLRPERVLSPRQTAAFESLVPLVTSLHTVMRSASASAGTTDERTVTTRQLTTATQALTTALTAARQQATTDARQAAALALGISARSSGDIAAAMASAQNGISRAVVAMRGANAQHQAELRRIMATRTWQQGNLRIAADRRAAGGRRSNAGRKGYVQAEDGSWVPRSFYGRRYDRGGLATGVGVLSKQVLRPERVLSPRQTAAFERLVPMLSAVGHRAGRGVNLDAAIAGNRSAPLIGHLTQQLPEGASGRQMADELRFELRRIALSSGVHG